MCNQTKRFMRLLTRTKLHIKKWQKCDIKQQDHAVTIIQKLPHVWNVYIIITEITTGLGYNVYNTLLLFLE